MRLIAFNTLIIGSILTWLTSCFNASKSTSAAASVPSTETKTQTTSFHSLKATDIDGNIVDFSKYKGKKIVVLNVASKCGYTPQYDDWQKFFDANKDNTIVLGFPCNQFMGQEPGAAAEIETFCQKNYGVTFEMFDKIDVKGDNQSPVYKWLSDSTQNGWNSDVPSWNFCKYLIDENGKLTHFFASKIKPDSPEFVTAYGK